MSLAIWIQALNRRIPTARFGTERAIPYERRGISIVELLVAGLLLGVTMASIIPMLAVAASERRAAAHEVIALQELENQLELFLAQGWDALTPENAAELTISADTLATLPGAAIDCSVEQSDQPFPGKRVTVELTWGSQPGTKHAPMRLTAWVFDSGQEAE